MKKVAILQSNYIPWKGYFDIIAAVDEFILYDDMQFTKNDWRNRNKIKTPQGLQWLTVPTGQKIGRRIRDVTLHGNWQSKHWKTLSCNYSRATYFSEITEWLKPLYLNEQYEYLSQLNRCMIEAVCQYLGITTKIANSWDYSLGEGKTERLVSLCKQACATHYVSGPAAKEYIDENLFRDHGINLIWIDYSGYIEYQQLWGEFQHNVTILDLLFHTGPNSHDFMKYVKSACLK